MLQDYKTIPVLVLTGYLGSGKTTLLKILAGIEKQNGGCVEMDNYTSIFIPNEGLLINNLSFNENINFYSSLIKDVEFFKDSLDNLITKFGLQNLLDKKVKNLSGGEKKILNIIKFRSVLIIGLVLSLMLMFFINNRLIIFFNK